MDLNSWDLTGPLMFLILRLISLAFNYHDGLVYEKEVVSLDEVAFLFSFCCCMATSLYGSILD